MTLGRASPPGPFRGLPISLWRQYDAEVTLRQRFNAFVADHETAWELSMAMFALAFVATGFVEDSPLIATFDLALTAIFVAEFGSRFLATFDRAAYLRGHWIDLFALIPTVRGFRLLRLLRLLRLVRAFSGAYRAMGQFERLARHRGLLLLLAVWLAVMVITSLSFYVAEAGANADVTTPFDALWWGVVTLTTVGYGDVSPVTVEGKIAATVLMVLGIGLFSVITATVVAALSGRTDDDDLPVDDPAHRLRRLDALRAEGLITADEYAERRRAVVEGL